jgi:hypothetical protein
LNISPHARMHTDARTCGVAPCTGSVSTNSVRAFTSYAMHTCAFACDRIVHTRITLLPRHRRQHQQAARTTDADDSPCDSLCMCGCVCGRLDRATPTPTSHQHDQIQCRHTRVVGTRCDLLRYTLCMTSHTMRASNTHYKTHRTLPFAGVADGASERICATRSDTSACSPSAIVTDHLVFSTHSLIRTCDSSSRRRRYARYEDVTELSDARVIAHSRAHGRSARGCTDAHCDASARVAPRVAHAHTHRGQWETLCACARSGVHCTITVTTHARTDSCDMRASASWLCGLAA